MLNVAQTEAIVLSLVIAHPMPSNGLVLVRQPIDCLKHRGVSHVPEQSSQFSSGVSKRRSSQRLLPGLLPQ